MKKTIILILIILISFPVFSQSLKWNGSFVLRPDQIIGGPDASLSLVKITAQGGLDIRGLEVVHDGLIEKIEPNGTYIDVYIVSNGGTTTLEITSYTFGILRIPVRTNDEIFSGGIYDISISLTEPPSPKLFNVTYGQGIYNLSHEKAIPGTNITFDLQRMSDMTLKYVKIGDEANTSGAYSYSFTMPDYDVHIMAKWEETEPRPIVDIPQSEFNYLTFTAQEPNSSVGIINKDNNPDIEYSTDGGFRWQKLTEQDSVVLRNIGEKMLVRGNNPNGFSSGHNKYTSFKMTGRIAASGSVMSLIDGKGESLVIPSGSYCFGRLFCHCTSLSSAPELPATTLADNSYYSMFSGCTNLFTAPELPATKLASSCYAIMFAGCTSLIAAPKLSATKLASCCYMFMFSKCESLTTAPELPATTLASNCYLCMFSNCTRLTKAPELPATNLNCGCYYEMFSNCTSLTKAPELPATHLEDDCYWGMFSGCTSLTQAPELPATTLAHNCYFHMFSDCVSLTAAPGLPATKLAEDCYGFMFKGCTSLNTASELPATTLMGYCYREMFYGCNTLKSVEVHFVDWKYGSKRNPDKNPTGDWLEGVASSGTFFCPRALKKEFGRSHIPEGWEVKYID